MSFQTFPVPTHLRSVIKMYTVCHDMQCMDNMLFLPNNECFIVFNRDNEGYSELYDGTKYHIPSKYFISAKHPIAKQFVLVSKGEQPTIMVGLTHVGYYKLFNKDASLITKEHQVIDDEIVDRYFSELYKYDDIEKSIDYLNLSLTKMLENNHENIKSVNIENVIDSIINIHHYEVTIEELVNEFKCSRSTLEREFKKVVGVTPKAFIMNCKLCDTFIEYINTNKSLLDTKHIYHSYAHLNHLFKKIFGSAPQSYMEDILNNNLCVYQLEMIKEDSLTK